MKNQNNKLLKKISQKQLLFGLAIVIFSLLFLFFLTRQYIKSETLESLATSTYRIEQSLKNGQSITALQPIYSVTKVDKLQPHFSKDTLIFDDSQNEVELFKELNTFKAINGNNYHIVVRTLALEYDDTLEIILITFTILVSLVYLAQYFYTKQLNKTIWKPFFENLEVIKRFSIQSNEPIAFKKSDILEFTELNTELELLTEKVRIDYQVLKQFTEDASHEIQTPLAIIQAKVENLFNANSLSDKQSKALQDIQKNVQRLSKLNKGLLLLTKIDNQQFEVSDSVDANYHIKQMVSHLDDIALIKAIDIKVVEKGELKLKMNTSLADILFSNLINNAIKHTQENGSILITITENSIQFCNTGSEPLEDPEQLFLRFYKVNRSSQSLGLGLAIVKKICNYYNFGISYSHADELHCYTLKLNAII